MRALTVVPKQAHTARLDDVPDPPSADGPVLVQTLAIGVCGTDREICSGDYGWAPPGRDRLILGHESLGRVVEAPTGGELKAGDLVVGIVRRPDPVPCPNCAVGEWDMCRNGKYTERGIKEHDGYCSERYRIHPEFAVKVDPKLGRLGVLLEPASVVAKAWEHVQRIGERALWKPRKALVTGAGPVGLLAAMIGKQRGLDVRVLDRVTDGLKPQLVRDLGAEYVHGSAKEAAEGVDVVIECTGVGSVVFDTMEQMAPGGILCLAGISSGGRTVPFDAAQWNRNVVLENNVVFGTVNANRRHYQEAADALAKADHDWLSRLIVRRVPIEKWSDALQPQPGDVKTIIEFAD
ncbi:MAG TPA: glucose 1-dehydrogenase [Planctomycetaceae bacterium]|nr:glucose 1-dehydrogenase [Planctomycetaceae bacterium]